MAKLKLTREMIKIAYQYARVGCKDITIYQAMGISKDSYYDYLKLGQSLENKKNLTANQKLIFDFFDSIKKGRSERSIEALARIKKAGANGSWQADAWFLERSNPDDWGVKVANKISGDKDNPVYTKNINANITVEDIKEHAEELNKFLNDLYE
jgi:hypothetical protein